MKKLLILVVICFAQNTFSQVVSSKTQKSEILTVDPPSAIISEENKVYNTAEIDVKPEFPGGTEFLSAFIQQNYKNPKEGLKGKVFAAFIIEKNGSLSDIKILKDIGYETGTEAIRILKLSPKWNPGKLNGKEVRVRYTVPITVN